MSGTKRRKGQRQNALGRFYGLKFKIVLDKARADLIVRGLGQIAGDPLTSPEDLELIQRLVRSIDLSERNQVTKEHHLRTKREREASLQGGGRSSVASFPTDEDADVPYL